MSGRRWLESVERELSRSRLPRQEVARLVAELADHLADVMESRSAAATCAARGKAGVPFLTHVTEKNMSMDASVVESLGSPAEITETAVREFHRRRNLLSRSRLAAFCTFVLLPLPALCLAWTAAMAGLMLFGEVLDGTAAPDALELGEVTGWEIFLLYLETYVILLAPAAGVAALFGRLARKTALHWRWGIAACLLVALGTGFVTVKATFSDSPEKSMVMFGVGIGRNLMPVSGLGQFLIPLATGVLVLRRQTQHVEDTLEV
jgi:hypothetical protein